MIKLVDKLYTSTEVAQILGVSLRSVYRYIEESKLTAEVKTATGRHRFTRQDILDFLYPDGPAAEKEEKKELATPAVAEVAEKTGEAAKAEETPAEGDEESVDWLSKFREAASKFKEEEGKDGTEEETAESSEEVTEKTEEAEKAEEKPAEAAETTEETKEEAAEVEEEKAPEATEAAEKVEEVPFVSKEEVKVVDEPAFSTEGVSGLVDTEEKKTEEVKEPKEEVAKAEEKPAEVEEEKAPEASKTASTTFFYRSSLGGLKDIAQSLDKNARESSLDYAFTLSSGLSLHKPIQPFSLLHSYVRTSDKEYFEKLLQLSPSDEEGSQLCLLISDEDSLYSNKEEMHGLYVVSKEKLKEDVQSMGAEDLKGEVEGILG